MDGRIVETRFPEVIDLVQPIMNTRALTHEVTTGLRPNPCFLKASL